MKILFIYPPYEKKEIFSFLSNNAPVLPPLGLAYLGGYLRKHSYKVRIIDGPGLGIKTEDIVKAARNYSPDFNRDYCELSTVFKGFNLE